MEPTHHFKVIDHLRGVAILLVIANHTFGYANVIPPMPFGYGNHLSLSNLIAFAFTHVFANGFLGVMLFFVLSGFCIRWSHLNAGNFKWSDFYKRRFFRIFPAYWFWLVVTAILSGAGTRDFLYHTLLAHNLVKEYYHSIYPPFWSIAIEWQIYLIYPLLIIAASKVRQHIMLILLAGIGIASSLISSGFIASLIGTDVLGIIGRIPTAFLFSWMLGFYMAESVKHGRRLDCSPRLLVLSLTVGVLFESYPNTCFLNSVPWTLAAYQTAALFISNRHHRVFRMFDWLAWVGVISYSIYLSHDLFAFTYSYVANFLNLTKGSVISGVSAAFVMIIPILLLGYISFKLIEMPGIWIGKQLRSNLWNPKNQKP